MKYYKGDVVVGKYIPQVELGRDMELDDDEEIKLLYRSFINQIIDLYDKMFKINEPRQ